MTHLAVHGAGLDSDAFREGVDRHLDVMSMADWELVSTDVRESTTGFRNEKTVDALFFWKK